MATHSLLAVRIHQALIPLLGEDLDVAALLDDPMESREVLLVCQASNEPELVALANQFFIAREVERLAVAPAARRLPSRKPPQDAAWARNTSGFGFSRLTEPSGAPGPTARSLPGISPSGWLRHLAQRLVG